LAAVFVSVLAVGIVAIGTLVLGGRSFVDLMTSDGHSAASAQSMFDGSVGQVVAMALIVAIVAATVLSAVLASRIARPLREMTRAASQIARGEYEARVSPKGPEELAGLAESFNSMAAALQEQERLRRDLIANAAHELRTPLTNLQGYLEALRDEVIPADRATFESLWDEGERLVRLSRSLDVLAEGDSIDAARPLMTVDVSAAVASAADLVAPAMAQSGLQLETDLEPSLTALAEPDGLAQVLGNLLQNAVRYTPSGGTVRLRAERHSEAVLVSVTNTGADIPAADLPHVFERFYRIEKSRAAARGGAGIGLAIVRQLVQSFGGRVGVESRDGVTRFWFSLPAAVAVEPSGTRDLQRAPLAHR
jgi:signal transduction histidine kinase